MAQADGMTTISDLRRRLRLDLHDPEGERWPDAALDRHIERALHELSLSLPDERVTIIATTPNSREVSLAGIPGLIGVEAVAYPSGGNPPNFVPFRRWGETLTILGDLVPDGSNATLWVTAAHTIDESGTTLPEHLLDVVAIGAAAYAALERALSRTETVNVEGGVPRRYAEWGRAWHTAFRQLLREHGVRSKVRVRRFGRT